jgi:hypothetical protein
MRNTADVTGSTPFAIISQSISGVSDVGLLPRGKVLLRG